MSDEVSSKLREELEKLAEGGLDESDMELLDQNKQERDHILSEIQELRERNERRKQERAEEEQRLASERAAEEARRKAEEEERRRKKEEDELKRKEERALKRAEYEKLRNPQKANFVINKKDSSNVEAAEGDQEEGKNKKSKEQLESEKRAILAQRVRPLEVDGFDHGKLSEKAKELHSLISRLESEKYDLEKRFKTMQVQLMELADRARQQNQVGKEGGLKRIHGTEDTVDHIQTKFAGAPAKVEMYSKYERQKDKRSYVDRKELYTGPQYGSHPERIQPSKTIQWDEDGVPIYK